jgi:pimeloyl-ACP methyl ester carboxylesterase
MAGPSSRDRVAVMLPGRAYTTDHPLLFFAREVLRDMGWRVDEVSWPPEDLGSDSAIVGHGSRVLDSLAGSQVLVIGKSLGSLLLPYTVEHALPAIWLTPLLTVSDIADAARQFTAPTLLVGGTADEMWDSQVAHDSGQPVLELPGGDHALLLDGDVGGSVAFLGELVTARRSFVDGLDASAASPTA